MSSEPPPTAFQTSEVLNKEHEQHNPALEQTKDTTTSPEAPAAAPSTTEKATEKTPVVPPTATAPTSTETPKDVPKGSAVVEARPISEGIMGYKAPGFPKSLIFSKKFFWLNDDPVESSSLTNYINNEKADVAHRNAAHASQSGKGLLFFAKRAEDKNHPAGILNLGEVSDVVQGDFNDFSFKLHGHKHSFQVPTKAERDGWLVTIKTKSSDARAAHEGLIGSSGYKSQLEKFGKAKTSQTSGKGALSRSRSRATKTSEKPAEKVVEKTTGKTPEKTVEPAATAPAETTTKPTPTAASTESKTAEAVAPAVVAAGTTRSTGSSSDEAGPRNKSKRRSESGKRSSIFGSLLGKKEDHDSKKEAKKEEKEEKKEIKKEHKAEDKAVQKEVKAEEKAAQKEIKAEEKAINKEAKQEEKAAQAADKDTIKAETAGPTASTGTSGLTHAEEIAARVVAAPLATEENKSIAGPTGTTPVTTGGPITTSTTEGIVTSPATESKDITSPTTGTASSKPNKRGSIFGNFFKKESQASAAESTVAAPAQRTETPAVSAAAPQLDDPVKSTQSEAPLSSETTSTPSAAAAPSTEAVAPTTSEPTGTAASPDTTKPNRRSSFFNNLGSKKEKRPDVASESETTDGEGRKSSSKLGGLFRKPSRATSGNRASSAKSPEKIVDKPTATTEPVKETSETSAVEQTEAPSTTQTDPALAANVSKVDQPTSDLAPEKAMSNGTEPTPVTTAA